MSQSGSGSKPFRWRIAINNSAIVHALAVNEYAGERYHPSEKMIQDLIKICLSTDATKAQLLISDNELLRDAPNKEWA